MKGWCERPTCMSNPRILKESGRGCGIGVESYGSRSIFLYIYTLRSAQDGAGTRRYATELVSPFSTLFHPVSSRYLDTTGFFSLASYEKYLHTPFGEIKYNSFVSIHRYAEMNRHSFLSCDSIHFYPIISYFCSLLLFNVISCFRYVCSFTYLERRWSNAEKKKNTLDSSDEEELSSRNFSLRNETEFLKIINNRPGGRGRIFNFNTSFFLSSPREEEAAAFLSPRHVADRLEIRRYKDTRRRFDDRKKPYTTKEKEREREVDLKDRCLRYRRGTKKPCGHENRLKHREAYREASHNLARQKDRAFVLPREKGAERGKNEMEEKRGEKEARVVWMRGWDKTGGERGFPRGSSPRSEVGVLIKPGSM